MQGCCSLWLRAALHTALPPSLPQSEAEGGAYEPPGSFRNSQIVCPNPSIDSWALAAVNTGKVMEGEARGPRRWGVLGEVGQLTDWPFGTFSWFATQFHSGTCSWGSQT